MIGIGRAGLLVAALLLVALGVQTCRLSNAHARLARETAALAAAELREAGFAPAEIGKPDRPADVPREATPILSTTGTARWGPVARGRAGASGVPGTGEGRSGDNPPTSIAAGEPTADSAPPGDRQPCDLGELDVSVTCSTEAVLLDGLPWIRTLASGRIAAWGQIRDLPERVTDETRRESFVASSVLPPRWRLDLLAGTSASSERLGLEAGAAWTGKGRLGGYALAEWLPATSTRPTDWRAHGGARVRVR